MGHYSIEAETSLNPYDHETPDFARLAVEYPDSFGKHVQYQRRSDGPDRAHIDFHDAEAVRALTQTLLLKDFGVKVQLPSDRLCPPVPNRLAYIVWIKNVLSTTRDTISGRPVVDFLPRTDQLEQGNDGERSTKRQRREIDVNGTVPHTLDIGTGAIAIYPLLGCASARQWHFTATDIDETSLDNVRRIVSNSNNESPRSTGAYRSWPLRLSERVTLLHRRLEDDLIPANQPQEGFLYHATMCNPPFFADSAEMSSNLEAKAAPPNAVCSGSANEMVTPGGESAFVARMIEESLVLKDRVLWYTSLLGKLSSLPGLLRMLKENDVDNYGVTEFLQGQTKRWALIWSFTKYRVPDHLIRVRNPDLSKLIPGSNAISRDLSRDLYQNHEQVVQAVHRFKDAFDASAARAVQLRAGADHSAQVFLSFDRNVWNRAARRAAASKRGDGNQDPPNDTPSHLRTSGEPILCLLVSIYTCDVGTSADEEGKQSMATTLSSATSSQSQRATLLTVTLQWTYGKDRADFNSFSSALLRFLTQRRSGQVK